MAPLSENGLIGFGEKLLSLLDEGRFTATYKYAVLLALLDLCMENASKDGGAPSSFTTWQLAKKVAELYWPQCIPFDDRVLKQSGGGRDSQAEILSAILRFRENKLEDPSLPFSSAWTRHKKEMESLIRYIEWKLIEMPLPRLQRFGSAQDEFLYTLDWDKGIRRKDIAASGFDNSIRLKLGVGESLIRLNGLLRPLIQRQWAAKVAEMNRLEEARLERFLFGMERIPLDAVRAPLRELHDNTCFYCGRKIPDKTAEVDHFIPWARYPDNGIENLVLADARCNNSKRDFLASTDFAARWKERFEDSNPLASRLKDIAEGLTWEHNGARTLNAARAIYLRLPADARLWDTTGFVRPDRALLVKTFS